MVIECAFGVLVRLWGVFWRPLEVKFRRRSALIGATMRLKITAPVIAEQSFFLMLILGLQWENAWYLGLVPLDSTDRKIGVELRQVAGLTEIQPGVYAPTEI